MTDYVKLEAAQKAAFSAAASHPIFSQLDALKDTSFGPGNQQPATANEDDQGFHNTFEHRDPDEVENDSKSIEQWNPYEVFENKLELLKSGHIETMLSLMVFHAPRLESLIITRELCTGEGDEDEVNALDGFVLLDALTLCLCLYHEKCHTLGAVPCDIPFMSLRRLFLGSQASGYEQVLGQLYPIMKLPNLEELYVWQLRALIYRQDEWKALSGQSTVRKLCIQQILDGRELNLMIDVRRKLVAFHVQATPEPEDSQSIFERNPLPLFTHLLPSLAKHAQSFRRLGFQTNRADNAKLIRDFVLQLPRLRFLRIDIGSGFGPKTGLRDYDSIQIADILPRSVQMLFTYVGGATIRTAEQENNKHELLALYDACVRGQLPELKSLVVFTDPDDPMEMADGMAEAYAKLGVRFVSVVNS